MSKDFRHATLPRLLRWVLLDLEPPPMRFVGRDVLTESSIVSDQFLVTHTVQQRQSDL